MKKTNPWDPPPASVWNEMSSATGQELYMEVGKALSQWSGVEHQLCTLFTHIFEGEHAGYAAYKLFGAYPSTSSRLTAVKTAGEAYFAGDSERWNYLDRLLGLVEKFSPRRNDIAHGQVVTRMDGTSPFLTEPHYNVEHRKRMKGNLGYAYGVGDVQRYGRYFGQLGIELVRGSLLLFRTTLPQGAQPPATALTPLVESERKTLLTKLETDATASPTSPE